MRVLNDRNSHADGEKTWTCAFVQILLPRENLYSQEPTAKASTTSSQKVRDLAVISAVEASGLLSFAIASKMKEPIDGVRSLAVA